MNITQQLKSFQAIFSPALTAFFDTHRQIAAQISPLAQVMLNKLTEFTLRGGKRMRPALLYYGYLGFTEENPQNALPIGIACELMQSFLLIHDDIMDQSTLRRGGQTIHQQFSGKQPLYGESMAILVGNLAGYLGLRAIASSEFDPVLKNQIMDLYAHIGIDAGYGQALDISSTELNHLKEKEVETIYHYKTARYTSEFPLISAAILTRQDTNTLEKIKKMAVHLGILFQIQDDILGLFGQNSQTGKETSVDLMQGKKTLLVCKAFEQSNTQQKLTLQAAYGNLLATAEEIFRAKQVIVDTGALTYAETMIKQQTALTLDILNTLNLNPEGKAFLQNLLDYCGNRDH